MPLSNKELAEMFLPKVEIEKISEKDGRMLEKYKAQKFEELTAIAKLYGLNSAEEYISLEEIARFVGKAVDEMIKEKYVVIRDGHVKELYLRKMLPEDWPKGIENLRMLNVLIAPSNRLKYLPDSIIENLQYLRTLDLSSNELKRLSKNIGKLKNLEELYIKRNKLEELPESIGELENLRVLNVDFNNLNSLPESVGRLKNLRILYIAGNNIEKLPKSLENLENLKELYVGGNPLDESSRKLLEKLRKKGVEIRY